MQHLFMFVTQAEGGAPGYLSGLGDDAALNLAETLSQFVESLGIDLGSGAARRMAQLEAMTNRESLAHRAALRSALEICPEVLLLAGDSTRSTKTIQPFVEHLALPVVVDKRTDVSVTAYRDKPALEGHLGTVLSHIMENHGPVGSVESGYDQGGGSPSLLLPRLIIVQTSLAALRHWLGEITDPECARLLVAGLEKVSEADRLPALLAAGFEGPAPGRWIIETPVL